MMEDKIDELIEEMREYRKSKEKMEFAKLWLLFLIFLAILIHMFACCFHAPSPALNDVEKYVYDEDGHPLRGAIVTLAYDDEGNEIYGTATTNCHGKAVFKNVPYGTYYINVSYFYEGQWYYGEEDWEEVVVHEDVSIDNYLSLHIGVLGDGAGEGCNV